MVRRVWPTPFFLVFAWALSATANAYEYSPIDDSQNDYASGMTRKLGRGLANTGLGWTEIFKGMKDVGEESGFWAGATWGPIFGTLNALRRTSIGVYETATFPMSGTDHFRPVLDPEFPLESS